MARGKRSYVSPVRAEQAARTRQRVIESAAKVFAEDGWSGASLARIARESGVTPQAVHLSVGAKPALMIAAVQHVVAGTQPEVRLTDREPFRSAFAPGASSHERASAFAAGTTDVYQRAGTLFQVLAQAATTSEELSELWAEARERRLKDCRRLVRSTLARRSKATDRLADLIFVQSSPGVYLSLVIDRCWTPKSYQSWLTTTLTDLLERGQLVDSPPAQFG